MPGSTIPNAPGGEKTTPLSTDKIALSGSQFAQLANLYKALAASPAAGKVLEGNGSYSAVLDSDLSISDITTNNATASLHGFLKKLSNVSTEFMNGGGNWATPAGGAGFILKLEALSFNPADSSNYIFGHAQVAPAGASGRHRVYILAACTLKLGIVMFDQTGTTGTAETSTVTLYKNGSGAGMPNITTAVQNDQNVEAFTSAALSTAFVAGDYIEGVWATPAWVTNPTAVKIYMWLYFE